jgi:glucan 1,3-beta-glucosidase
VPKVCPSVLWYVVSFVNLLYLGDGVTDDTAAINSAISSGSRCVEGAPGCESSTTSPAVVYFPAGTYLISSSILPYYMTQLVGNPNDMPVLKATASFSGLGLVDGDPYGSSVPDYGTTNLFYRQVRNLVFDTTNIPAGTAATGIHWPTAQATSLQNCVFQLSQASPNSHVGVFIENGQCHSIAFSLLLTKSQALVAS